MADNEDQQQQPDLSQQIIPPATVIHQDDGKLGERVARLESTTVTKDDFNKGMDSIESTVKSSINEAVDKINQKPVPVTPASDSAPSTQQQQEPTGGDSTPPVQQQKERKPSMFETHQPYRR